MFVNCDRQLGRAQVVVRAQVSDGCAGRGKAEFRDPCGRFPNRDGCHEPPSLGEWHSRCFDSG